jgi:hypothetical protein
LPNEKPKKSTSPTNGLKRDTIFNLPKGFFMQRSVLFIITIIFYYATVSAQTVPAIYTNIHYDENGKLYVLNAEGEKIYETPSGTSYDWDTIFGNPKGTKNGVAFDFGESFNGFLTYGFIPENDSKYPQPIFLWKTEKIEKGKAEINMTKWMRKQFDIPKWEKFGKATIGYRVMNEEGEMILDSKINVLGKSPFTIAPTIIEGPFVAKLGEKEATIWFKTNSPIKSKIKLSDGTTAEIQSETLFHEFVFTNLKPATNYDYVIEYGEFSEKGSFRTANPKGDEEPFVFAYASDSRNSSGGGERDIYGVNVYVLKKIFALASQENVRFMQFTGDIIDGYTSSLDRMKLQYYNWKYAVAPFAKYFPVYPTMGNHENYDFFFVKKGTKEKYVIDKFPFDTESSEAVFADEFVLPVAEVKSEDGAVYDPDPNKIDFPPYDETVYSYVYGNVAVVVLNSDYLYSPSLRKGATITGGGLHGYIMDMQLEWLKKTLDKLEADEKIEHIFVSQHTPILPNGGHLGDGMWYHGNNEKRPYIAGKPLEQGILERRDEYLDIVINNTKKVRAILTGDEHNYSRTLIAPGIDIYPKDWNKPKLTLKRAVYQINNGAAGAPYYSQEKTPWSDHTKKFTTQNALVLFYVNGQKVHVVVKNPDTLELIEEYDLL